MPRAKARHPKSLFETCVYSVARHLALNYNPTRAKALEGNDAEDEEKSWVESWYETLVNSVERHIALNYNPTLAKALEAKDAEDEEKSASKCSKYVNNPFEALPSQLLQPIIDSLTFNEWLDMKHCDLLLTSQTRRLDCSRTGWDLPFLWSYRNVRVVTDFLHLAATKCPQLAVLILTDLFTTCSLACYHNFLPKFKHLQVLDVQSSRHFDDSCLQILAIHCRDLRELNVTRCMITDDGIKALCGVTDQRNKISMGQGGGCKFIEKLVITHTEVTQKGVEIVLRHLPHLKILESIYVIEALDSLYHNYSFRPHQCKLTKLYVWHNVELPFIPFANGAVRLAAWLCPLVTHLDICFCREVITDRDLLGLVTLTKLREIKINLEYRVRVTFEGGLGPLLEAVGSSLKSLKLITNSSTNSSRPLYVSADSLIEYCPNLESVSLSCSHWSSALRDEPSSLLWKNLKELNLMMSTRNIPTNVLNFILSSSPALKRLFADVCDSLDDDLLQRVFQYHSFESLEVLHLSICRFVSKRGIDLFLTEGNSVRKMIFKHCTLLTKEDLESWREKGKMNGWDLEVN